MPGLRKALRRQATRNSRSHYDSPEALDSRLLASGVGDDGTTLDIDLYYDASPDEVAVLNTRIARATALRLVVCGQLLAVDLLRGRQPIARLLTTLFDERLVEIRDAVGDGRPVTVRAITLAGEPTGVQGTELPIRRADVSVDEFYGPPTFYGSGHEQLLITNRISGKIDVWMFDSVAELESVRLELLGHDLIDPPMASLPIPDSVDLGAALHNAAAFQRGWAA